MSFDIAGLANNFVPSFTMALVFGASAITSAASAMRQLNVGMVAAPGTLTPDKDVRQVFSTADVDAQCGPGTQLAQMDYSALQQPNIALYHAAPAAPGGGTAATMTILFNGVVTAPGTWVFNIAGQQCSGGIQLGVDTKDTVGAAVAAGINNTPHMPVNATFNVGTHTLTVTEKCPGLHGNDWLAFFDPANFIKSGLTATLAGSAVVDTNAYFVRLGATPGAGLPNVTNIIGVLGNTTYQRIAVAQYDTGTNATLWQNYIDGQASPFTQNYEQLVMGFNGALSAAQTLSATTLNDLRFTVAWCRNSEWHPAMIAAGVCAARTAYDGGDPLTDFDGAAGASAGIIPGMPAQRFPVDLPLLTEQNTALQNGVTAMTSVGTKAAIVRGITTHCLSGSLADYRTIDWGDVNVVDAFAVLLSARWSAYKIKNGVTEDNPDPAEPHPPAGIAYPNGWDGETRILMDAFRTGAAFGIKKPLIQPYQDSDSTSYFEPISQSIRQQVTITPGRVNHGAASQILQG